MTLCYQFLTASCWHLKSPRTEPASGPTCGIIQSGVGTIPPSTNGTNADDDHRNATEASPASKPATWCTVHYHQVHHSTSVTIRGKQQKNSIRECHCHAWGHVSRSGLFVASWSNSTRQVLPNTTPYQHWPALTLEQPSTLVLHCRCRWEAPRWHPMRQAAVAVGSSRGATCDRGPAVSTVQSAIL